MALPSTARAAGSPTTPVPGQPAAAGGEAIMATVNGRPVYMRELYAPLLEAEGLRVAEMLIATAVVVEEARRRGLSIAQKDIDDENDRLLQNIFKGDIDDDQRERLLDQLLKSRGLTRSLWQAVLRRRALLRKIIEPQVKITDTMVRAEHARQFGEKVEISHIQLASLREAESILKRLNAGEDFATLAQKYSTNPKTARAGGRITPAFTRTNASVPQAMRDAAFALQSGQLSGVIQAGTRFHVLKLHQRLPPSETNYEKVEPQLRSDLRERSIEQLALQLLARLRGQAEVEYIDPVLRQAAEKARQP